MCERRHHHVLCRAREGLSMCPLLTPPKESSIPCSLRNNNSSRRDRKNGHVMLRFSIFLGKIGRGFVYKKKKRKGFCVLQICIRERERRPVPEATIMVFGRETTRNTRLHRLDDTDEPPLLFCSMRPKRSRLFSSFRSLLLLLCSS